MIEARWLNQTVFEIVYSNSWRLVLKPVSIALCVYALLIHEVFENVIPSKRFRLGFICTLNINLGFIDRCHSWTLIVKMSPAVCELLFIVSNHNISSVNCTSWVSGTQASSTTATSGMANWSFWNIWIACTLAPWLSNNASNPALSELLQVGKVNQWGIISFDVCQLASHWWSRGVSNNLRSHLKLCHLLMSLIRRMNHGVSRSATVISSPRLLFV